jgi:surfeit locus 1 family protein
LKYQFKPSLLGFVVLMACVLLFIKLGYWQYHKAQQKLAFQSQMDKSITAQATVLPTNLSDLESLRFKQVKFVGQYDASHQIYLDNQLNGDAVGFHIITPVKLKDRDAYILVNRGWVAANARHDDLPKLTTPDSEQIFEGQIWVPSSKFFTLEKSAQQTSTNWQTVWQNMDLKAYQASVNFKVLPYMVKLNPNSAANGFERNWPRPDDRSTMHLGYAYQWFGFALAACLIYLFVSFKKKVV